jgi:hypothetical protein
MTWLILVKKVNLKYYSNLIKSVIIAGLGVSSILTYRLFVNFPIKYILITLWEFNNINFAILYSVFDFLVILIVSLISIKLHKYETAGMFLLHIPVFYDLFNILSFLVAGEDRCYYVNSYLNYSSNEVLFLRLIIVIITLYFINKLICRVDKKTSLFFYLFFISLLLYLVI